MTIKPFDKKLLRFLYFLVTNHEYMNSVQISKKFSIDGKKMSDRTIRRWFLYLHKNHKFDYFPYINYESIGLSVVFVIVYGLKNKDLLKIIPYNHYIFTGVDLKKTKNCLFVGYCIPHDEINNFKLFWKNAKERKIIKNYEIMNSSKSIHLYSQFHKIITKDGNLKISENYDIDNSFFLNLLKKNLEKSRKVGMHKAIIRNPFIIPIIFRYFREHWSSREVWHSIKKSLEDDVWKYIKIYKKKRKRTDGRGIRFVQETMKTLHNDFHDFFKQIQITYSPFYEGNNFISYVFLKLNNKKDIIKLGNKILKHSLSIKIHSIMNGPCNVCFYILTNNSGFIKIVNIINEYTNDNHNKILLMDYFDSWIFWNNKNYLKLCPSLFDPTKLEWKYEHKKYMNELKKIKI